jgi:DNA-binding NarL/FixJ family response regulator
LDVCNVSRIATQVYRPLIGQPRVLLVVSHPAVGSGIETLLRLERRYQLRRATKLGDAVASAREWPADAALVDAAMLLPGARVGLGVPALVLAASDVESRSASRALDDPRGWVAKDASGSELVRAVESLLTGHAEGTAGSLAVATVGLLAVVLLLLLLYLLWIAIA